MTLLLLIIQYLCIFLLFIFPFYFLFIISRRQSSTSKLPLLQSSVILLYALCLQWLYSELPSSGHHMAMTSLLSNLCFKVTQSKKASLIYVYKLVHYPQHFPFPLSCLIFLFSSKKKIVTWYIIDVFIFMSPSVSMWISWGQRLHLLYPQFLEQHPAYSVTQ